MYFGMVQAAGVTARRGTAGEAVVMKGGRRIPSRERKGTSGSITAAAMCVSVSAHGDSVITYHEGADYRGCTSEAASRPVGVLYPPRRQSSGRDADADGGAVNTNSAPRLTADGGVPSMWSPYEAHGQKQRRVPTRLLLDSQAL